MARRGTVDEIEIASDAIGGESIRVESARAEPDPATGSRRAASPSSAAAGQTRRSGPAGWVAASLALVMAGVLAAPPPPPDPVAAAVPVTPGGPMSVEFADVDGDTVNVEVSADGRFDVSQHLLANAPIAPVQPAWSVELTDIGSGAIAIVEGDLVVLADGAEELAVARFTGFDPAGDMRWQTTLPATDAPVLRNQSALADDPWNSNEISVATTNGNISLYPPSGDGLAIGSTDERIHSLEPWVDDGGAPTIHSFTADTSGLSAMTESGAAWIRTEAPRDILASLAGNLVFDGTDGLAGIAEETGEELWRRPDLAAPTSACLGAGTAQVCAANSATDGAALVAHKEVSAVQDLFPDARERRRRIGARMQAAGWAGLLVGHDLVGADPEPTTTRPTLAPRPSRVGPIGAGERYQRPLLSSIISREFTGDSAREMSNNAETSVRAGRASPRAISSSSESITDSYHATPARREAK